jgi:hypothetical protein
LYQQRLYLPTLQRGGDGVFDPVEISYQGGGLLFRIILSERHQIDLFTRQESAEVSGGR